MAWIQAPTRTTLCLIQQCGGSSSGTRLGATCVGRQRHPPRSRPAVFDAMLEGWRRQSARFLKISTIAAGLWLVRRMEGPPIEHARSLTLFLRARRKPLIRVCSRRGRCRLANVRRRLRPWQRYRTRRARAPVRTSRSPGQCPRSAESLRSGTAGQWRGDPDPSARYRTPIRSGASGAVGTAQPEPLRSEADDVLYVAQWAFIVPPQVAQQLHLRVQDRYQVIAGLARTD